MKTEIICISCYIGERKRYVRFREKETGKKYYPDEYSPTPESATHFQSLEQAEKTIPKIQNFLDREFTVETVTVDAKVTENA